MAPTGARRGRAPAAPAIHRVKRISRGLREPDPAAAGDGILIDAREPLERRAEEDHVEPPDRRAAGRK